jgi:16S rRNA (cytosine1402-N4)-methyltransferase
MMMTTPAPHYPVLMNEVVHALAPKDGGCYVDATFGAGGYTQALLQAAECTVWAIDRDPDVRQHSDVLEQSFPGRITLLQGCFGDMEPLLEDVGVSNIDGVAIDLGVSSMQLDEPTRGFSFRNDGPLDMRMAQSGMSAADVVNTMAEQELADIIYQYGGERASRKIARAIVELREEKPFERTSELANLVRRIVRKSKDGIDPATRTFQALRIHVNDELGEVERGLRAAEALLSPGGRLAVVTFHSLEDRLVKRFFRDRSGDRPRGSRHMPADLSQVDRQPSFSVTKRSGVKANDTEIRQNPRSRSARLRWAERTAAAPWNAKSHTVAGDIS